MKKTRSFIHLAHIKAGKKAGKHELTKKQKNKQERKKAKNNLRGVE